MPDKFGKGCVYEHEQLRRVWLEDGKGKPSRRHRCMLWCCVIGHPVRIVASWKLALPTPHNSFQDATMRTG